MNHLPTTPTTNVRRGYRFHVIAEVTGSYGEKILRTIARTSVLQTAFAKARAATATSSYVEIRNPSNGWHQVVVRH